MINSIKNGEIINSQSKDTLSDGSAGGVEEGSITFDLCRNLIDEYCLVSVEDIAKQIRDSLNYDKIVIEGAAAVAIASLLKMKKEFKDRNILFIGDSFTEGCCVQRENNISEILNNPKTNSTIKVSGWVRTKRSSKK